MPALNAPDEDHSYIPHEDGHAYPMRLQKFLARAGVASRRGSEKLMTEGRVRVNGQVVTQLGSKVDPESDTVEVDGNLVAWGAPPAYIMLNKPVGYLTTMSDPQGRACVAQLVPSSDFPGLYPVGRLDRASCGLLLFTTDGRIGNGLLHPSHHVDKTYLALVEGEPNEEELSLLRFGIVLDDGPCAPAQVALERVQDGKSLLRITIHEGRYRQVRRMCAAVGHECLALERVSFGPLVLGSLPAGEWRHLDEGECAAIVQAACEAC